MSQPAQSPPPRSDKTSRASSKLGSFSRTAVGALSRRRSTTITSSSSSPREPLSSIDSTPTRKSPAAPTVATTSQSTSVDCQTPLPRNSTSSNLSRPMEACLTSASKEVVKHQSRLMSPQSTVSHVKSRIPTPSPRFKSPVINPFDVPRSMSISGPELIMPTFPLSRTRPTRFRHSVGLQDFDIHDDVEELKQFTPMPRRIEEAGSSQRRRCGLIESNEKQFPTTLSQILDRRVVNVKREEVASRTPNREVDNTRSTTLLHSVSRPVKSNSSQDIVIQQLLKPVGPPSAGQISRCAPGFEASSGLQDSSFVGINASAENSTPSTSRASIKPIVSILKPLKQSHLHSGPDDDQLPLVLHNSIGPTPIDRIDQNFSPDSRRVYQSQTTAFWTGRLMSMSDHSKTEAFIKTPSPADENGEEKMHAMDEERTRQIFAVLEESCRTFAAKESLLRFKKAYAIKFHKLQILQPGPSLTPTRSISKANSIIYQTPLNQTKKHSSCARFKPLGAVLKSENSGLETSDHGVIKGRRNSFMDRLVGKNKRDSMSQ